MTNSYKIRHFWSFETETIFYEHMCSYSRPLDGVIQRQFMILKIQSPKRFHRLSQKFLSKPLREATEKNKICKQNCLIISKNLSFRSGRCLNILNYYQIFLSPLHSLFLLYFPIVLFNVFLSHSNRLPGNLP